MKNSTTTLQFDGSNSNYTNRLSLTFKTAFFILAALISGSTGAFSQTPDCVTGTAVPTNIQYFVNGNQVNTLKGNVKSGNQVKVSFTTSGSSRTRFSLVSYQATAPAFDSTTADQSKIYDYATRLFSAGNHTMQIKVPDCFFQIDFVKGCIIEKLGPHNTSNFYSTQNRLIDSYYGGKNTCQMLGVDVIINNQFQSGYTDTTVIHMTSIRNTSDKLKDALNISVISNKGWKVRLYNNSGTKLMASDDNGDGIWEYVNNANDKDNNGEPDTKALNAGDEEELMITESIPASANTGELDTLVVYAFSSIDNNVKDMEMTITEVSQLILLPIELLSFNAVINGTSVTLNWATAQEINNDFFTIERSPNGTDFDEILTVRGAGNSNTIQNYSTDDKDALSGRAYYRLKQTDFDGQNTTSNILIVNSERTTQTISIQQDVYPNPFTGTFQMGFNVDNRGTVIASIRDIQGKVITTSSISASKGLNQFSFGQGSSLPKGLYFISLEYNGEVISSKIAKTDF